METVEALAGAVRAYGRALLGLVVDDVSALDGTALPRPGRDGAARGDAWCAGDPLLLGELLAAFGIHDPAKVVFDLALALAIGGDCLAVALLRAEAGGVRPDGLGPDRFAHDLPVPPQQQTEQLSAACVRAHLAELARADH